MKCNQCDRPGLFLATSEKIPLCVQCYHLFSETIHRNELFNMAQMNNILDEVDAMLPYGGSGGRYPVRELARAMARPMTYNNIRVDNSQIGVLNTGSIARIDAAITLTKGSDTEVLGGLIQRFTEQLVRTTELDERARSEVVELLETLSEQVVGQRKRSTIWAIITAIQGKVATAASLAASVNDIVKAASDLFG